MTTQQESPTAGFARPRNRRNRLETELRTVGSFPRPGAHPSQPGHAGFDAANAPRRDAGGRQPAIDGDESASCFAEEPESTLQHGFKPVPLFADDPFEGGFALFDEDEPGMFVYPAGPVEAEQWPDQWEESGDDWDLKGLRAAVDAAEPGSSPNGRLTPNGQRRRYTTRGW